MPQYQRTDRISEEVRREVDRIIRDDVNDPRVAGTFSVTRADVTRDLRYAKIYVSNLDDSKRSQMIEALNNASGYIRKELGRRILIRTLPELIFVDDRNIEYGIYISQVIKDTLTGGSDNA